ncbi:putative ribonuclease H-like domain-containing protein [Tanacetum coccineum]
MNYVPVVAGTFSNHFTGIQGVSESSTSSQQDQDCIIMPIWKDASYFGDASPRTVVDAQIEDTDELHDENDTIEKSHDDSSLKDNGTVDQQVNTAIPEINTGSREVNTALLEVKTATPVDLVGPIPTTPHTRIHKDHLIKHVIGDVQSSVQTRRMKTSYSEQEEPKRVSKALSDPAWVEAMQEELLQFKLQKVWILVDLPKGHTQEEAIRIFLAYASYMEFMVYQMDVKSAFLYGQIEEEFDFEAKYHLGKANVDVVPWSRKKE